MKKKMNLMQLNAKQQAQVRAGAESGNTCGLTGKVCACACPQGWCDQQEAVNQPGYTECMPNPA